MPCPISFSQAARGKTMEQLSLFTPPEDSFKVTRIVKRNGRTVKFDREKITNAIYNAAISVGGSNREVANRLANKVISRINQIFPQDSTPTVEEIQDLVERVLI